MQDLHIGYVTSLKFRCTEEASGQYKGPVLRITTSVESKPLASVKEVTVFHWAFYDSNLDSFISFLGGSSLLSLAPTSLHGPSP